MVHIRLPQAILTSFADDNLDFDAAKPMTEGHEEKIINQTH